MSIHTDVNTIRKIFSALKVRALLNDDKYLKQLAEQGFESLARLEGNEQTAQDDVAYCICNPNEAPYKVGYNLCAVCEKPRL